MTKKPGAGARGARNDAVRRVKSTSDYLKENHTMEIAQ